MLSKVAQSWRAGVAPAAKWIKKILNFLEMHIASFIMGYRHYNEFEPG
jgi:hypothetical protein